VAFIPAMAILIVCQGRFVQELLLVLGVVAAQAAEVEVHRHRRRRIDLVRGEEELATGLFAITTITVFKVPLAKDYYLVVRAYLVGGASSHVVFSIGPYMAQLKVVWNCYGGLKYPSLVFAPSHLLLLRIK